MSLRLMKFTVCDMMCIMNDVMQVLEDFDSWIKFRAWSLSPTGDQVEDLVQEARIAIWKALPKFDPSRGSLSSYVATVADFRMRLILKTHRWTGGQKASSPYVKRTPDVPVYELDSVSESQWVIPDSSDLAYHQKEIAQSVKELTPRQRDYVVGKFWEDKKQRELPSHGLWDGNASSRGAKAILRDKLKHLEGVADV